MRIGIPFLFGFICSIILTKITIPIIKPLIGIAFKWIVIGRVKPGRYSLFSSTYLRWWLVEKLLILFDKGIFEADIPFVESLLGTSLIRLYYVLLGAKIGANFKISKNAILGQPDLLSIGDNVCIESAIVRGFALEEGHFILLPIQIGDNCAIGEKSVVAPGTILLSIHVLAHAAHLMIWKLVMIKHIENIARVYFQVLLFI